MTNLVILMLPGGGVSYW